VPFDGLYIPDLILIKCRVVLSIPVEIFYASTKTEPINDLFIRKREIVGHIDSNIILHINRVATQV